MNNFQKLREKAGFTQEALAKKLLVDRTTVAKWESGSSFPRASLLFPISRALNCSVDDLLRIDTVECNNCPEHEACISGEPLAIPCPLERGDSRG